MFLEGVLIMFCTTDCYLLDQNEGDFVGREGNRIKYRNARFYDLVNRRIFKVRISDQSGPLPEEQVHVTARFSVNAGEKFCSLTFDSFEAL